MMQDQPMLETGQDILFLLTGAWDDGEGGLRLCIDCCTMEGALKVNPHWLDTLTVVRVDHARPRAPIVALLDDDNQNAPTLILADDTIAHVEPEAVIQGHRIYTSPRLICAQLAACYSGARP
ncbi:MAG: hypothetical protein ACJA0K_002432 [Maricaulis maris]|jgi:hypothetical protein